MVKKAALHLAVYLLPSLAWSALGGLLLWLTNSYMTGPLQLLPVPVVLALQAWISPGGSRQWTFGALVLTALVMLAIDRYGLFHPVQLSISWSDTLLRGSILTGITILIAGILSSVIKPMRIS